MKKGDLEPHIGAHLYTTCSGDGRKFGRLEFAKIIYTGGISDSSLMYDSRLTDSIKNTVEWKLPFIPIEDIDPLNANRTNYGLEMVDLYAVKALFSKEDKIGFKFYNITSNVYFTRDRNMLQEVTDFYRAIPKIKK